MKDYLTTSQTAERLGISSARVRQMIIEGIITKAEKIGRDNFIPESEVKRLEKFDRKPGRPQKTENANQKKEKTEKSSKTIFDFAPELVGCLDSGLGDLSTNKKYMEGFGTKEAEKGKSAAKTETTAQTAFDIAGDLMNRLLAKQRDLPLDLSTNKDYLKDLGQKSAEKKRNNES